MGARWWTAATAIRLVNILVIGYGNELRGDDAIGPFLTAQVADWRLPGVATRIVRQLTPELSQELPQASYVLFIDAGAPGGEQGIQWQRLEPAQQAGSFAHIGHPGVLLALAQALYQKCPEAWLMTLSAQSFELGAAFSPDMQELIPSALRQIRDWIQRWRETDRVAEP